MSRREMCSQAAKPCPICKSPATRLKYRLTGYDIDECRTCGFQFNGTFKGGGGDGELFSETYFCVSHREAFEAQLADYHSDPSADVFVRRLEQVEQRISRGRVLDVGCAFGTFLRLARDRGWEPHGVEISRFAARFARTTHHLRVFEGDLEDVEWPEHAFDLVTFWDSIEHLSRPLEALAKARFLTRPGGVILLTTDNFDCLVADTAVGLYRASFGTLRYPMERIFLDRNLAYFTAETFRDLLKRVSLKEIFFEKMEYPLVKIRTNWLERLALKGFYRLAHLLQRQAQMTVLAVKG